MAQNKQSIPLDVSQSGMSIAEIEKCLGRCQLRWELVGNQKIRHVFQFNDFISAINFVDRVAEAAEIADHHPDIHIHYSKVIIELWTHDVNGLSEKDFDLAAEIEKLA